MPRESLDALENLPKATFRQVASASCGMKYRKTYETRDIAEAEARLKHLHAANR
jgi:hypothetical protein